MQKGKFNNSLLTLIESENLYENYTGRRYGYKFKAEYKYKKTQDDAIYHRINIVCREVMPKSPEVNVEITISCAPLGVFEKVKFLIEDGMTNGSNQFVEAIVKKAFRLKKVLEQSIENESRSKQRV